MLFHYVTWYVDSYGLFLPFCLGVIAVIYLLRRKELKFERKNFNFCNNPNCLRCSGSETSCANLEAVYKDFVHHEKVDLPRIQNCIEQSSLSVGNSKQKPTVFFLPDLETQSVMETSVYKTDVKHLQSICDSALKEYYAIAEDTSWVINSTPNGSWRVFYLFNQGQEVTLNTKRCPVTTKVIKSLPNFMNGCAFGNACFSVLQPDTVISEHYGPCNVRIRCHLGMKVTNNWKLHVDNEFFHWKQHDCILFDDSFLHSVSYEKTSQNNGLLRIVLMVDLWHHNLTKMERSFISKLYPPR